LPINAKVLSPIQWTSAICMLLAIGCISQHQAAEAGTSVDGGQRSTVRGQTPGRRCLKLETGLPVDRSRPVRY
jgi:hypothetical protein